ncbi:hypothetical protein PACTADRAFT_50332 [Pachysolen tannophilus NRRL Y-2460]|uniref:PUA domain-containing protein n=1 Tax=Pachysolen tannophilus NRRL Y-2460 TaxID=669874 RepID=A0A1E4TV75_PACTA|nr:hypothetical protein PACTADRAFT_50332 [Pachysolen tannophilus NRRL Y-2460]
MSSIVETVVKLRRQGHKIILVSSGAIAFGMQRVDIAKKPKHLSQVQALAAIGQGRLIALWDDLFGQLNQPIAQILLTRNDITNYTQFQNAKTTIDELLKMDIVPIVNENDTLSIREIQFGDNDTLSAVTAGMCNSDYLFLMTDVDCLYTDNPRTNADAKPVMVVKDFKNLKVNATTCGSAVGTGGMKTKIIAAELGASAGVTTVVLNSGHPENILKIVEYSEKFDDFDFDIDESITDEQFILQNELEYKRLLENDMPLHTRFLASKHFSVKDKEFWLLHGLKSAGSIIIDPGCYKAISNVNKAGLLPVGIIAVEGSFHELECVSIKLGFRNKDNTLNTHKPLIEVGRARCNYSSTEIDKIKNSQSHDIFKILGYFESEYVVHRENFAFPLHLNIDVEKIIEENDK